jgi:hypothetical protein
MIGILAVNRRDLITLGEPDPRTVNCKLTVRSALGLQDLVYRSQHVATFHLR